MAELEWHDGYPALVPEVHRTAAGVRYLTEAGVALLSAPDTRLGGARRFAEGFDPALEFPAYFDDPDPLPGGESLVKFAGQVCYVSLGPRRTWNRDASRYFANLRAQGHGSVMEFGQYVVLWWGVDRTVTHEAVRHRAGTAFAQVSQRYVDGSVLRFVERPEYQPGRLPGAADESLRAEVLCQHLAFESDIDRAAAEYDERAGALLRARELGHPMLDRPAGTRAELRKLVNQAARDRLPNCAEAPIVVGANARAWRHIAEARGSTHADVQIRDAAVKTLRLLRLVAPRLFEDYREEPAGPDGSAAVATETRKV